MIKALRKRCQAARSASISSSHFSSKMPVMMVVSPTLAAAERLVARAAVVGDVFAVGQEDRHLDQIVERHAGGAQLRDDVLPRQAAPDPRKLSGTLPSAATGIWPLTKTMRVAPVTSIACA